MRTTTSEQRYRAGAAGLGLLLGASFACAEERGANTSSLARASAALGAEDAGAGDAGAGDAAAGDAGASEDAEDLGNELEVGPGELIADAGAPTEGELQPSGDAGASDDGALHPGIEDPVAPPPPLPADIVAESRLPFYGVVDGE